MEEHNTKIQLIRDEFRKLSNNLTNKFLKLQELRKEIKEKQKNSKIFGKDKELQRVMDEEKSLHEEIKMGLEIQKRLMKSYQYELLKKGKVASSRDVSQKEIEIAVELTKGGRYDLNKKNPCWTNENALQILLMYYENEEQFEKCAIIHEQLKKVRA